MKKIFCFLFSVIFMLSISTPAFAANNQMQINIEADGDKTEISQTLYGISLEDKDFGIDGGLSSNMINNNSFEYSNNQEYAWEFDNVETMVSTQSPINKNNPTYETITSNGNGYIRNLGFTKVFGDGDSYDDSSAKTPNMTFKKDTAYIFTCYMMNQDYDGKISAFIDTSSNKNTTNSLNISSVSSSSWTKVSVRIVSQANEVGAFGLKLSGSGTICIDYCTLIPEDSYGYGTESWKNSSLNPTIVENLKNLNPSYISFPGGCVSESDGSGNLYNWKDTIGEGVERKQHTNVNDDSASGYCYNNSNLVGYYEYFQLCEELNAIPIAQVGAGIQCQTKGEYEAYLQAYNKTYMDDEQWEAYLVESCGYKKSEVKQRTEYIESLGVNSKDDFDAYVESISLTPGSDEFTNYVQDILDLIEYANGDSKTSYWGAIRAQNGSEKAFNLEYIQIGGDSYSEIYWRNFEAMAKIINEKFPGIKVIASSGANSKSEEYNTALSKGVDYKTSTGNCKLILSERDSGTKEESLATNFNRFDSYSRSWASVFCKYASLVCEVGKGYKNSNLSNGLDEAVYMLGCEQNSDVVSFMSYDTVLARKGNSEDKTSLIWIDSESVILTPSYYIQMIFGNNLGKYTVKTSCINQRQGVYYSVSVDDKSESVYIKIVNTTGKEIETSSEMSGFKNINKADIQFVCNDSDRAYNSGNKQTVSVSQGNLIINEDSSITALLEPYSASVIRIAYGDNTTNNFYQIPGSIDTNVERYISMSKVGFIILLVVIFIIATAGAYILYIKFVLKGKGLKFNNKANKSNTIDKESKADEEYKRE